MAGRLVAWVILWGAWGCFSNGNNFCDLRTSLDYVAPQTGSVFKSRTCSKKNKWTGSAAFPERVCRFSLNTFVKMTCQNFNKTVS